MKIFFILFLIINITLSCGVQLKKEEEEENIDTIEEDLDNQTLVKDFEFFQEVSSNTYLYLSLSFVQKGEVIPTEGTYKLYLFKKSNSTKMMAIGTATIENDSLILTPDNVWPSTSETASCQNILNQSFAYDSYQYGSGSVWIEVYDKFVCMDKSSIDIVNIAPTQKWNYSCFTNEWITISCD